MDTHSALISVHRTPCGVLGSPTTNNPNNTVELMQIQDYTQFGVRDGNGSALSNYHLWDMSQRGPMNALAMYYMVKNPNILFGYDPAGSSITALMITITGSSRRAPWLLRESRPQPATPVRCSIPLSGRWKPQPVRTWRRKAVRFALAEWTS